ncbi:MAG: phosphate/phosphite/phosphonate ABC transporter substrate-binding protein [Tumebacillaceae bacterium]
MKKRAFYALLLSLILTIALVGCGGGNQTQPKTGDAQEQKTFTVGLIPAETKISADVLEKFRAYLEKETGMKVALGNYPDYNGVVEAMNYGKLDMAYLGPLTYTIAHHKGGAKAIVAKTTKDQPFYYSYILVNKDAPYNTLEDLLADKANVTFAFGDPNSTSASLIPGIELKKRGVYRGKEDSDFKKVLFTGAHDATALAIQNKQVTAGAIDSAYYDKMVEKGTVKAESFKKIWQSDKLFQYPFAVSKTTDDATIEKLRTAFVNLKDKDILDAFAADGFVKAEDSDYEAIRKAAEADGRLK